MRHIQSKIGGRSENQDFYGSAQTRFGELIVVCDGMGGHNGGRHAAEVAVQSILEVMKTTQELDPEVALKSTIEKANSIIWEEGKENPAYRGMGTTVVALVLNPDKAICAHVGDSRIYQLREGNILHRTFDHSYVFEMVRAGILTEEQARVSEKSNIITRALGISPTVQIDITDNLPYQAGDRFLLCTDGIWGVVPEPELVEMVSRKDTVEKVLTDLVEKIDAIGFENGGRHDNLTAALAEIESNSTLSQHTAVKKKKNRLIYLILLAVMAVLSTTFFFFKKEKQIKQPIEKRKVMEKQIIKSMNKSDSFKVKLPKPPKSPK